MTKKAINEIRELEIEIERQWAVMWKYLRNFNTDRFTSRTDIINFYWDVIRRNYKRIKEIYEEQINKQD